MEPGGDSICERMSHAECEAALSYIPDWLVPVVVIGVVVMLVYSAIDGWYWRHNR